MCLRIPAIVLLFTVTLCDAQSDLSTGQIVGISVGVPMAVLLIAVVIFLLWRRRRNLEGKKNGGFVNKGYESVTETATVERREEAHSATLSAEKSASHVAVKQSTTLETVSKPLSEPKSIVEKTESSTQTTATEVEHKQTETKGEAEKFSVSVQTTAVEEFGRVRKPGESEEGGNNQDKTVVRPLPSILERRKSREDITFMSGWRREVKLTDLMRAKLILETRVEELEREEVTEAEVEHELAPFLIGRYPIAGVLVKETGKKMALYEAYKQGIITRGTAVSLLEAQAAVGSIIDPRDGSKMSVNEAKERQLIDAKMASVIIRAERAVTGYKSRATNETLSLFQAMKRNLVVESHGIRLLEAQIATGGIIDPVANCRLTEEVAFERGLYDKHLHRILEDPSDDTKGFLDPNIGDNLTYLELIQRCVEDKETGLLYLPLVPEEDRRDYMDRYSNASFTSSRSPTLSPRTFSSGSEPGAIEELTDVKS